MGAGKSRERWHLVSGEPWSQRENFQPWGTMVCGGGPSQGVAVAVAVAGRVPPLKARISHQWTGGLHLFCGHFHMEPAQTPTGAVRVDSKPSEPSGKLALCLWGLSVWVWQSLLAFVQSSRPGSRASWCSEKLLPPLSFPTPKWGPEETAGAGGEKIGVVVGCSDPVLLWAQLPASS